MDRTGFNNLEVLDQIGYINSQNKKSHSLEQCCKQIGISKKTVRDRFKVLGYFYSPRIREYAKNIKPKIQSNTPVRKVVDNSKIQNNINISEVACEIEIQDNTTVSKKSKSQNKIMELSDRFDDIEEMLIWFKLHKNDEPTASVKSSGSTVNLDTERFTGGVKITTIRLYKDVQESFQTFCKLYPQLKAMDMQSQALLEYMENHKK